MTRKLQLVRLKLLFLVGVAVLYPSISFTENLDCGWNDDRSVVVQDGWIHAAQETDESSHRIRVAVWGPERVNATCEDLDDDDDAEVVISSRGVGSGPYYRLQIVDFRAEGILSWSYWSDGVPMVERGRVLLGDLHGRYHVSGATPEYKDYDNQPERGLVDRFKELIWIQSIAISIGGEEIHIIGPEFKSNESCVANSERLVQKFIDAGQDASYLCQSNADIQKALDAFNN